MSYKVSGTTEAEKSPEGKLGADFWKFWTGQAISAFGSSFTGFALPLLVYKLTGSAINLALTTAAHFIPYLLFGLVIGAWVDRADRKRLMIYTDIGRAVAIASIPALALLGGLSVWWIYAVAFINSTLGIIFHSAQFAAIPSLVKTDDLVTANGRIEASFQTATVTGPLLAGLAVALMPIEDVLFFDAMSFLVSAVSLALIATSFNASKDRKMTNLRQDIVEGLRYVLGHPVLRNISLMMALVNFVGTTKYAQQVLFAKEQFGVADSELGFFYSSGSIGVILLSLAAGRLRKRYQFSKVALGALMLHGLLTIVLAFTPLYWLALPVWAAMSGLGVLFNINTGSLRQAIVPNHLLGRVLSIAGVLAWSANPLGAFAGGWLIERTGNVSLVYAGIGVLTVLIPLAFAFTPLGHAERYLPKKEEKGEEEAGTQMEEATEGEEEIVRAGRGR